MGFQQSVADLESDNANKRAIAILELSFFYKINEEIEEKIIVILGESEQSVVRYAIRALGGIKSTKAVPLLVGLLNHEDCLTRWVAADALGEIAEESTFDALIKRLTREEERGVQEAIIRALGHIIA